MRGDLRVHQFGEAAVDLDEDTHARTARPGINFRGPCSRGPYLLPEGE